MIRRSRVAALVASVCALGAPVVAGASVEIRSVDTGSYPRAQATIVTSKPSKEAPQLTEGGKPAAGVLAKNLGESRSICLAVDHSRSMRGVPLTEAVVAAQAFVAAKLPTDRICVTSFATKPLLLAPFTDSEAEASAALESIKVDPEKGTALYDDVRLASQTLAEEEGRARIIILVTDGNETQSSATLADAIKGAQEAETTVYVIAIESKAFTPGPLKYLAKRTGGRYYGAPSPSALQGIYAELAAELKRTWRLDYVTSGRPGESPKLVAYVPGLGRDSARSPIAATAEVAKPGGLLPAAAYGKGGSTGLGLLVGLLVLLAVVLVFASANADRVRAQVQKHIAPKPKRSKKTREKKERLQALAGLFQLTEQGLGETRLWLKLSRLIERADLQLKTAELFYMSAGSCIVLGLLATAAGSSGLLSLASLVIGALIPLAFVWMKARRRLAAFENQLPDLLIGIAASLKAGHSFKQALQAIVDEGVEPAGKEFKRVLTETRLGRPLDDALNDMAERVGSANLSFIVTAVAVQSQVGGSLASLFDMVADTVRNRQQFARKIKALTAMGRMSAYVLVGLPFFLCGALTLLNPTYMAPLFQTSSGHKMIVVSLVMMGIGSLALKKIVSFKG
jgi:tight adherence protein B